MQIPMSILNAAKNIKVALSGKPGKNKIRSFNPVSEELLSGYNRNRPDSRRKILCYAPFNSIYFGRDGNVVTCCHNRKHILGTYPQQSISEIWNGEKLKLLRTYIGNNDLSCGCHICKWDLEQRNFTDVKALHFDSIPVHERFPSMMEFEIDNTCNLECAMCSGEFSSAIRKNREQKPEIPSVYDLDFVRQLHPFIPHLSMARFSGGEPFLVELYYKIWEKIAEDNPGCLVSVQTNGTVLNTRVKEIFERCKFEIGVSVDSLDKETFEKIRINARFEKTMENLNYFRDYCKRKNTSFRISVCGMRNNWREIPSFVDFCNRNNAYLQIHTVWFPPASSLWNLDADNLDEIYRHFSSFSFGGEGAVSDANRQHFKNFMGNIAAWRYRSEIKNKPVFATENQSGTSKERFFKTISDFVSADSTMAASEKKRILNELLIKAGNVFMKFDRNENMEEAICRILEIPPEFLVTTLMTENEDRIYERMLEYTGQEKISSIGI